MFILFHNFRIVDETADFTGSVFIRDGFIQCIIPGTLPEKKYTDHRNTQGAMIINGNNSIVLMPAFIDLHAHFRDTGSLETEMQFPAETVESASLAAAIGGYGTVVCMANSKPVIDNPAKAKILRQRADAIGLIDLYPAISLTENMDGRVMTHIQKNNLYCPLMISEDGKDINDDALFLAVMKQAANLGIPVSCHCDIGGESNAVRRVIELGKAAGCHIHIAHVSKEETAAIIKNEKHAKHGIPGFTLTCEATPHHIAATEEDARRMGAESHGRVNPPLRSEADRLAIIEAIRNGTIDAIATDHAPHSNAGKTAGAPGFTGLETAFSVCLANAAGIAPNDSLKRLSALMSASPARILGLKDRGRVAKGLRADLVIADINTSWKVDAEQFASRGKCSPFAGKTLQGRILMTFHQGRIVYEAKCNTQCRELA
jgi:dihydroorotase